MKAKPSRAKPKAAKKRAKKKKKTEDDDFIDDEEDFVDEMSETDEEFDPDEIVPPRETTRSRSGRVEKEIHGWRTTTNQTKSRRNVEPRETSRRKLRWRVWTVPVLLRVSRCSVRRIARRDRG